MAPLKSPSMDWELPTASRIFGCAGSVIVMGTCAMATLGAAAAASTGEDHPHRNDAPAERRARAIRSRVTLDISLCIIKFLAEWLTDNALQSGGGSAGSAHALRRHPIHGDRWRGWVE